MSRPEESPWYARRLTGVALAALAGITAIAIALDAFVLRRPLLDVIEAQPGFMAGFAAFAVVAAMAIARLLRIVLGRGPRRARMRNYHADADR
ncbi:MAG: hypothetical protein AB7J28_14435 [Hyphomonadaceae bacterium]